jgi:hypothetical protein
MLVTMYTIPHHAQRYNTVGDWQFAVSGDLIIKVSAMSDPRYETLIAAHELGEAVLCKQAGVSEEAVDAWDWAMGSKLDEPGDDPRAPYHRQHVQATIFEKMLAKLLGVDWKTYEAEVMSK